MNINEIRARVYASADHFLLLYDIKWLLAKRDRLIETLRKIAEWEAKPGSIFGEPAAGKVMRGMARNALAVPSEDATGQAKETPFNPSEWEQSEHRDDVTGQPTGKIQLTRRSVRRAELEGVAGLADALARDLGRDGRTQDASEVAKIIAERIRAASGQDGEPKA